MRNKCGFSLVELMVAIAIIGILAVVGVPATNNYMQQRGLRVAVDDLHGELHRTKLEAIKRKRPCNILINDPGPNQYTNDCTGEVINLSNYRGNVRFTAAGGVPTAAQITFNPTAWCTQFGSIVLTSDWDNDTRPLRVRVTVAGGISKSRWDPMTLTWSTP